MYEAAAGLAADFRDVIFAVDVVGLSYKEAASALRLPEGTVMSRLYRGRNQVAGRVRLAVGRLGRALSPGRAAGSQPRP